jgi:diketogulonate reductase-like aldo/keto reductase
VKVAEQMGWTEGWNAYNNEHTWTVLDTLFTVAEEVSKTPAQVAINWLMNRPGVTAPIIGARTMKQLEDDLGALRLVTCRRIHSPAQPGQRSTTVVPIRLCRRKAAHIDQILRDGVA